MSNSHALTSRQWQQLSNIRQLFLEGGGIADYWRNQEILEAYHRTFAQRILWKWQAVMSSLEKRIVLPDGPLRVLDWGCGSGVAGQAFLEVFGDRVTSIVAFDRSMKARRFSCEMWNNLWPDLQTSAHHDSDEVFDVVLISHVLTELKADDQASLERYLQEKARCIIWVEPGTSQQSRQLIRIRERLGAQYYIYGPCPHQGVCGLTDDNRAADWCHFFADPPNSVHQSAFWREFSQKLGIDLRSLPVSFLAMGARTNIDIPSSTEAPVIIGRVRAFKGYCQYLSCGEGGVSEYQFNKRQSKKVFKDLQKSEFIKTDPGNDL